MKIRILSHNFTGQSLVMVYVDDNGVHTKIVERSHPNWTMVLKLYKAGNYTALIPALDVSTAINRQFKGRFVVKGSQVFYGGHAVSGYLVDRILFFMRELPQQSERLIKFAEKLYRNPNQQVIQQLYKFLEHKGIPLTDDGDFLAYKGVAPDYYSHTAGNIRILKGKVKNGRVYNGVGEEIIAERNDVCDDPTQGCAAGLHIGSWQYANDFRRNGHLMVVKSSPADAVMVPSDCGYQKLRSCHYFVIAEEGRMLHEVKDSNFERVVKVRFNRDSLGRFTKFCRDAMGRFMSKV